MMRAEHGVRPVNESLEAGLWIGRLGGALRVGSMPLPLMAKTTSRSGLVNPGGDILLEVSKLGIRLFLGQLPSSTYWSSRSLTASVRAVMSPSLVLPSASAIWAADSPLRSRSMNDS